MSRLDINMKNFRVNNNLNNNIISKIKRLIMHYNNSDSRIRFRELSNSWIVQCIYQHLGLSCGSSKTNCQ